MKPLGGRGGEAGWWTVMGAEGCPSPPRLSQKQAEAEQPRGLVVPPKRHLPEAFSADCGIQVRTFGCTRLF